MYMNKLESIPPDIGQLKSLTALGLNENNLKKLPPEIGNLTRLRILVSPLLPGLVDGYLTLGRPA